MKRHAIETVALTKRFGKRTALRGMTLQVEEGRCYGLLGPNGSGKTTTIRILVCLARATSGTARLFGLEVPLEFEKVRRRIGALLESPSFHPGLNALDNLIVLAHSTASRYVENIDSLLDRVGLSSAGETKFGAFSQGMRQRLGLGAALLYDPDLIILDEPLTGLDPTMIVEFRELVRQLVSAGKTVFLASHILSEVEQVCDTIGFIKGGSLVADYDLASLRNERSTIRLLADDPDRATQILAGAGQNVRREGRAVVVAGPSGSWVETLLAEKGVRVLEVNETAPTLEELYREFVEQS